MGHFWYLLGSSRQCRESRNNHVESAAEQEEADNKFLWKYSERIEYFLQDHQNVLSWAGKSPGDITLTMANDDMLFHVRGHLVLNEDGEIIEWVSDTKNLRLKKMRSSLSEEKMIAQLQGILHDAEASKYCEMVAATLLEAGSCIFNVPEGLRIKDFSERYHTSAWKAAWITALNSEFQAEKVVPKEGGCFLVTAM